MAKIYIGTSGWSYPTGEGTWNGYFYPPGTKNELEYYSRFLQYGRGQQFFLPAAESGLRGELGKKDAAGFSLRSEALAEVYASRYVPCCRRRGSGHFLRRC